MEIKELHKLCVESISEGFNYINLVMGKKQLTIENKEIKLRSLF